MAKDPQVDYIEADQEASILARRTKVPTTTTPTTSTSQSIPWGITRVGGGATYTGTNSAWVIDSGILLSHPDLNVDLVRGISFVTGVTSPNDDNGHGTHVAGTIAAINNSFGVVGVAAGAKVVPVKVMDSSGSGTTSSVLAGINYVMSNGKAGDVVNMSIGAGISPTIDDAVLKASAVLKFAIAAGNESDYAYNYSPGRVNGPNVYTVSAMGSNSSWAYFSNFGNTTVDYCAPGMTILSTYKNGSYIAISGTSMAAPHVAGLLLLGSITTSGYVTNDPDGTPDRIAHR
jgi:subtilisin family serine protease